MLHSPQIIGTKSARLRNECPTNEGAPGRVLHYCPKYIWRNAIETKKLFHCDAQRFQYLRRTVGVFCYLL